MLFKTHFALALFFILLLIGFVYDKGIFFIFALIGMIIPDLDSRFSKYGKKIIFRPFQFFIKHRGAIHSVTFAAVFSFILGFFFPAASFGFFIGYCSHIIGDSFTIEGVQVFWPLASRSYGFIRTGGKRESILFFTLVFVDTILLVIFARGLI